ncbi:MAG: tail fiber domain-containing protein, partial [Candidatus Hydrogenedentes bacterium]|nr:tail fiber domain-containing protein [Candidatus Hydrogenedentota bacterium]
FAAGKNANDGGFDNVFIWGDSGGGTATASDQFNVHASGGIVLNGSVEHASDRNLKEGFAAVSAPEVLEKVLKMPVSTWRFKSEEDSVRHIGPMAQDFKAAFGYGGSDTHITSTDADGVALAAIQGLNQKLEDTRGELQDTRGELAEKQAEIDRLEAELAKHDEQFASLEQRLLAMEASMN